MTTTAGCRVAAADVRTFPLVEVPTDRDAVVSGSAQVSLAVLGGVGPAEIGIWELTEGTVTDVEVDEVFVVLDGSGTVMFDDDSVVALCAGVAVRLCAGDRTRWTVHRTLRKLYVVVPEEKP